MEERRIGRYLLKSPAGKGAMGVVWEAEDTLLKRTVALKILPPDFEADPDVRARFLREARAASGLNHPHIATVFDAGTANDVAFIAFQFVHGNTLDQLLRDRGPLPLPDFLRLARQALDALTYAHRHGVLHRDLSARNIMIDRRGDLFIVDFGLARMPEATKLTGGGALLGTPAYLAPEVWQGEVASEASDFWSLGVVFHQVLTGQLPFPQERLEALMHAVIHEEPVPLEKLRSDLPHDVLDFVEALLDREPENRRIAASEALQRLTALESPQPAGGPKRLSLGDPRSRSPRSLSGRRRTRKEKTRLRLLAAVGVTLGIAVILTFLFADRFRKPALGSVAVLLLRASTEEDARLAWGMSETLVAHLSTIPGVRVLPWATSQRFTTDDVDAKSLAHKLGVEALVEGTIDESEDGIHARVDLIDGHSGLSRWTGEFHAAESEIFDLQKRISTAIARALVPGLKGSEDLNFPAPGRSTEAYKLYLRGSEALWSQEEDGWAQAMSLFERAVELDSTLADAWVGLGAVISAREYHGKEMPSATMNLMEGYFKKALTLKPGLLAARRGLVQAAFLRGDRRTLFDMARQFRDQPGKTEDEELAYAETLVKCGMATPAVRVLRHILNINPENVTAQWFLVVALTWSGDYEGGLAAGRDYVRIHGDDDEILRWMGTCSARLGRNNEAFEYLSQGVGSGTLEFPIQMIHFLRDSGREEEAIHWLEDARVKFEERLARNPDSDWIRSNLGAVYFMLGRKEDGQAVEEWMRSINFSIRSRGNVLVPYLLAGRFETAAALLDRTANETGNAGELLSTVWNPEVVAPTAPPPFFMEKYRLYEDRVRRTMAEF